MPLILVAKAVLFDMDGVLFDSRDAARARFQEVLEDFGYEFPEARAQAVNRGGTDPEIIRALIPDVDEKSIVAMAKLASEITSPLKHLKINRGVKDALARLSKTHKLAIVSNDNRRNVIRKLEMFGLKAYFNAIIAAEDVKMAKPNPEPLEKALELLGIGKEDSVYIGDNEVDGLAGEAAKIRTIIRNNIHEDKSFFAKEIFELAK